MNKYIDDKTKHQYIFSNNLYSLSLNTQPFLIRKKVSINAIGTNFCNITGTSPISLYSNRDYRINDKP